MAKIIDMERVRKALAELDRLVADNPDKVDHSAPSWMQHMADFEESLELADNNKVKHDY